MLFIQINNFLTGIHICMLWSSQMVIVFFLLCRSDVCGRWSVCAAVISASSVSEVPPVGRTPTMAGWVRSKNRRVSVPSLSRPGPLSLASRGKQEVVKDPPWSGRGSRAGSGDWTLLELSGTQRCELRNSPLLSQALFMDRCQKLCDLALEWNLHFSTAINKGRSHRSERTRVPLARSSLLNSLQQINQSL